MSLAAVIARSKTDREAWRYTSLAALEGVPFAKAEAVGKNGADRSFLHEGVSDQIVFVNGIWQPEQSRLSSVRMQGDAGDGYHLTLAAREEPVELELIFSAAPHIAPVEAETKLRLTLGDKAQATLIERHIDKTAAPYAHLVDMEIQVGKRAKLAHGKFFAEVAKNENAVRAHLAKTDVRLEVGAAYENFTLLAGGGLMRNEINATLAGEKADCRLLNVSLLKGADHADATSVVTHAVPHGVSRQGCRAVVADQARAVCKTKTIVAEGAQKTDAHQTCRALLLSKQAEIDAKPELEVYADDVKCGHGCAIGELDEAALFYLRSRGIGEAEARALLVEAFLAELVEAVQSPRLRAAAQSAMRGGQHG